jgi:hypothetical protein
MATKKAGKRGKTAKHLSKSKKLKATKPLATSYPIFHKTGGTGE